MRFLRSDDSWVNKIVYEGIHTHNTIIYEKYMDMDTKQLNKNKGK